MLGSVCKAVSHRCSMPSGFGATSPVAPVLHVIAVREKPRRHPLLEKCFPRCYRMRKPKTGKFGPKWFYKGRGCLTMGSRDRKSGKFRWGVNTVGRDLKVDNLLDLQVPNLEDFDLKPYVAWKDPDN